MIGQEHPCQLTDDITDLLDRELDLMGRGVGGASLDGLRQRISTLLLQFIKTPAFNPEVARHLQVSPAPPPGERARPRPSLGERARLLHAACAPQTSSLMKSDTLLCRSCHRYQLASRFTLAGGCQRISRCRACAALDHLSRARRDVCSYQNLLLRLRAQEQQQGGDAAITFLLQVAPGLLLLQVVLAASSRRCVRVCLQVEDMQYLVEDVWTFCSAKESSDLDRLDFVRWDRRRAWSPWNCILLPKEETSSHLQVEDLQQVRPHPHNHPPAPPRPQPHPAQPRPDLPGPTQPCSALSHPAPPNPAPPSPAQPRLPDSGNHIWLLEAEPGCQERNSLFYL